MHNHQKQSLQTIFLYFCKLISSSSNLLCPLTFTSYVQLIYIFLIYFDKSIYFRCSLISVFIYDDLMNNAMFFDQGYNNLQSLAYSHDFKHNIRLHHQMSRLHVNKGILQSQNINPMITRNTNQNGFYTFKKLKTLFYIPSCWITYH